MPIAGGPQSNIQHPVPQNIMDVEFKLIGDLTMRQFIYLLIFGLTAYLSYILVIGIFKWPTVIFFALFALGLAFAPVEERGLDEWVVNFIKAIRFPTQRIWKKEPTVPSALLHDNIDMVRQEMITLAPTSSRRKLEYYLTRQGEKEKVDPLDIPEREYVMKVRKAFPNIVRQSVAVDAVEHREEFETPSVGVAVIDSPPPISVPEKVEYEEEKKEREDGEIREEEKEVKISEPEEFVSKKVDEEGEQKVHVVQEPKVVAEKPSVIQKELQVSEEKPLVIQKPRFVTKPRRDDFEYKPLIPEMHTGRRFVNLLPSEGELILPIRGEKVLKTSEQIESEEDVKEKANKLQQLLKKIRQEEGITEVRRQVQKTSVEISEEKPELSVKEEVKDVVSKLKEQNKDLSSEIQKLKEQIGTAKSESKETTGQEQLLEKLEEEKERITSSYSELSKRVRDLQQKLGEKNLASTGPEAIDRERKRIKVLTNIPNVVSGVVRDKTGKPLEDILMIVKNERGEAVRAFKSDSVGQYILSTPLNSGRYTVEVSPVNKVDLTFDIIPIEVNGEILPPIEMIGK